MSALVGLGARVSARRALGRAARGARSRDGRSPRGYGPDRRDLRQEGDVAHVTLTYTAMGCPGMNMIEEDIHARLLRAAWRARGRDRDGLGAGLDEGAPDRRRDATRCCSQESRYELYRRV